MKLSSKIRSLQRSDQLQATGCGITEIDVLSSEFHQIRSLYLSYNSITNIININQFQNLEILLIQFNCLSTISDLKPLHSLSRLRILRIEGNPVTNLPLYDVHAFYICKSLEKLDSKSLEECYKNKFQSQQLFDFLKREESYLRCCFIISSSISFLSSKFTNTPFEMQDYNDFSHSMRFSTHHKTPETYFNNLNQKVSRLRKTILDLFSEFDCNMSDVHTLEMQNLQFPIKISTQVLKILGINVKVSKFDIDILEKCKLHPLGSSDTDESEGILSNYFGDPVEKADVREESSGFEVQIPVDENSNYEEDEAENDFSIPNVDFNQLNRSLVEKPKTIERRKPVIESVSMQSDDLLRSEDSEVAPNQNELYHEEEEFPQKQYFLSDEKEVYSNEEEDQNISNHEEHNNSSHQNITEEEEQYSEDYMNQLEFYSQSKTKLGSRISDNRGAFIGNLNQNIIERKDEYSENDENMDVIHQLDKYITEEEDQYSGDQREFYGESKTKLGNRFNDNIRQIIDNPNQYSESDENIDLMHQIDKYITEEEDRFSEGNDNIDNAHHNITKEDQYSEGNDAYQNESNDVKQREYYGKTETKFGNKINANRRSFTDNSNQQITEEEDQYSDEHQSYTNDINRRKYFDKRRSFMDDAHQDDIKEYSEDDHSLLNTSQNESDDMIQEEYFDKSNNNDNIHPNVIQQYSEEDDNDLINEDYSFDEEENDIIDVHVSKNVEEEDDSLSIDTNEFINQEREIQAKQNEKEAIKRNPIKADIDDEKLEDLGISIGFEDDIEYNTPNEQTKKQKSNISPPKKNKMQLITTNSFEKLPSSEDDLSLDPKLSTNTTIPKPISPKKQNNSSQNRKLVIENVTISYQSPAKPINEETDSYDYSDDRRKKLREVIKELSTNYSELNMIDDSQLFSRNSPRQSPRESQQSPQNYNRSTPSKNESQQVVKKLNNSSSSINPKSPNSSKSFRQSQNSSRSTPIKNELPQVGKKSNNSSSSIDQRSPNNSTTNLKQNSQNKNRSIQFQNQSSSFNNNSISSPKLDKNSPSIVKNYSPNERLSSPKINNSSSSINQKSSPKSEKYSVSFEQTNYQKTFSTSQFSPKPINDSTHEEKRFTDDALSSNIEVQSDIGKTVDYLNKKLSNTNVIIDEIKSMEMDSVEFNQYFNTKKSESENDENELSIDSYVSSDDDTIFSPPKQPVVPRTSFKIEMVSESSAFAADSESDLPTRTKSTHSRRQRIKEELSSPKAISPTLNKDPANMRSINRLDQSSSNNKPNKSLNKPEDHLSPKPSYSNRSSDLSKHNKNPEKLDDQETPKFSNSSKVSLINDPDDLTKGEMNKSVGYSSPKLSRVSLNNKPSNKSYVENNFSPRSSNSNRRSLLNTSDDISKPIMKKSTDHSNPNPSNSSRFSLHNDSDDLTKREMNKSINENESNQKSINSNESIDSPKKESNYTAYRFPQQNPNDDPFEALRKRFLAIVSDISPRKSAENSPQKPNQVEDLPQIQKKSDELRQNIKKAKEIDENLNQILESNSEKEDFDSPHHKNKDTAANFPKHEYIISNDLLHSENDENQSDSVKNVESERYNPLDSDQFGNNLEDVDSSPLHDLLRQLDDAVDSAEKKICINTLPQKDVLYYFFLWRRKLKEKAKSKIQPVVTVSESPLAAKQRYLLLMQIRTQKKLNQAMQEEISGME